MVHFSKIIDGRWMEIYIFLLTIYTILFYIYSHNVVYDVLPKTTKFSTLVENVTNVVNETSTPSSLPVSNLCDQSEYGCCPDNITLKTSENDPCSTSDNNSSSSDNNSDPSTEDLHDTQIRLYVFLGILVSITFYALYPTKNKKPLFTTLATFACLTITGLSVYYRLKEKTKPQGEIKTLYMTLHIMSVLVVILFKVLPDLKLSCGVL